MAKAHTRWGNSRLQFAAILPEISAMLEKGYSKRMIFEQYTAKGCLTMGYRGFCLALAKHLAKSADKGAANPAPAAKPPVVSFKPQSGPKVEQPPQPAADKSGPVQNQNPANEEKPPSFGTARVGFHDVI